MFVLKGSPHGGFLWSCHLPAQNVQLLLMTPKHPVVVMTASVLAHA